MRAVKASWIFFLIPLLALGLVSCREDEVVPLQNLASVQGDTNYGLRVSAGSEFHHEAGVAAVGILYLAPANYLNSYFRSVTDAAIDGKRVLWAYEMVPQSIAFRGQQAEVYVRPGEKGTFYFSAFPDKDMRPIKLLFSTDQTP